MTYPHLFLAFPKLLVGIFNEVYKELMNRRTDAESVDGYLR